ncbi:MAG: acyl-CoA desaturase, partial [Fulvivirga sp.]
MKVRFNGKNQAEFYPELKQRIEDYFKSNNISKNANGMMIFKSVFFLGSLIGIYLLIILGNFSLPVLLLLAILLG